MKSTPDTASCRTLQVVTVPLRITMIDVILFTIIVKPYMQQKTEKKLQLNVTCYCSCLLRKYNKIYSACKKHTVIITIVTKSTGISNPNQLGDV